MAEFVLTPESPTVELAPGWRLTAPGIEGTGDFQPGEPGVRRRATAAISLGALDTALAALDMRERGVVEIAARATATLEPRRRAPAPTEAMELEVPDPPEGFEQVVLEARENGTVVWHVAYEPLAAGRRRAGAAGRRYRIPLRPAASRAAPGARRGLFSTVARRVLKVLIYPITDFVLGRIERSIARAWESSRTPYGVRAFDAANFRQKGAGAVTAADWARLATGPALLFVHGTFSTAHGAFAALEPDSLRELSRRYGERTLALDHWTLSHDPRDNVKWFLEQIPTGLSLDLDVVCHSRGGLVSRVLANARPRVRVGRIVFVATPNEGTLLADADHVVKLLDRYTNLIQFFPDGPLEVVLEGVITAVKTLAHAGLASLPGLAAQSPAGDFLPWLRGNPAGTTRYFAITADWEPAPGSPLFELVKQKVADKVADEVFEDAKNDLVVPTLGVGETATGPGFPIDPERIFTFTADQGAIHTNLFGFKDTSRLLLEWLDERGPLP